MSVSESSLQDFRIYQLLSADLTCETSHGEQILHMDFLDHPDASLTMHSDLTGTKVILEAPLKGFVIDINNNMTLDYHANPFDWDTFNQVASFYN